MPSSPKPLTTGFIVPAALSGAIGLYLAFGKFDTFMFFGFPILAGIVGALILRRLDPKRTTADHVTDAMRIYFGLHLIWSSSRYWLTDMQPVVPHPIGGPFIQSLLDMGLFPGIKAMEGLVGIVLLTNRFVPLMLVLQVPTSFTIFYLNAIVVGLPRQLITGPLEIGVNCALLLAYFRYYQPFLTARAYAAPPRFMGESALDRQEPPRPL
ncbi:MULTISPECIES: dipeptidyl peptidase 3 [unclassified Sphingobium]|uniref:dipeptidyl peptidase 3 n=1 Tax=unclassified Sphingobium TaxID=2611147 RepID=UPI002223EEB4|nr:MULTISPECIES: dipeptidyl peptidase 3 [unclassified Sphingobium]MCW2382230.1 hypothetical protein [Sphingobium sp. B2D3B]MCW2397597.1 hypothetical protein [Sphingobium sp. B2D3C]